ncbi:MAG TPA: right-handed parallel beta-helix repeat-containing protein, partial [Myxococcaceae bacterium]|nr:right-handed parallel beta-helix repeat-containing protein [Myxococcaceae bacterium]
LKISWSFTLPTSAPPWPDWTVDWTSGKTASHAFTTVGLETVVLAVKDADADIGYAARTLSVANSLQEICVVNSGTDRDDGALDCAGNSGPDGVLSIDEAVRLSQSPARTETIVLIPPTPGTPMPLTGGPLTVDSVLYIVGTAGVTIQREIIAQNSPVTLIGVEVAGPNGKLTVPNGTTLKLLDSTIRDAPGIEVDDGHLAVERTRFERCIGACIIMNGPYQAADLTVSHSSFSGGGSGYGIDAQQCVWNGGSRSLDLISNTFSGFDTAIRVGAGCVRPTRVVHQTFHGNAVGIDYLGGSQHELLNNIFTGHSQSAILGCAVSFATGRRKDHLLYGNASDGCIGSDPETLRADPKYVSAADGDFRLRYESPAVDRAAPTGLDVNGAAPGDYQGSGPDLGGRETY